MRTLVSSRWMSVTTVTMLTAVAMIVLLIRTGSEVGASTTAEMQTCQDNSENCAFYPSGDWRKVRSDNASGGSYHVSSSKTKPAVFFPAAGPEINLVTATGPKRETAKVYVINMFTNKVVKVVEVPLRAKRTHYNVVERITGLEEDQLYAVAVVSANGKPVVVDALESFPPQAPSGDQSAPPPPPQGDTPLNGGAPPSPDGGVTPPGA